MQRSPLVLRSDELEAVLLPEHGARLHRLRAHGLDLLRTPDDPGRHADDPFFWGAYVMAPWCNRIRPGPTEVAGRSVDLRANFPDGTAIHGQVYDRPWEPAADGWLTTRGGDDGWPWAYEARLRPTLEGPTLGLRLRLVNRSDGPMPAGLGLHPWFVGAVRVGLEADAVYPTNSGSPPRPEPVDATRFGLRSSPVPPRGLDATWSSLRRSSVQLAWPEAGIAAELEIRTSAAACVAVATPADPDATAVEPQTHGPDGLRRLVLGEPDPLSLLAPGASLHLDLRLRVRRTTGAGAAVDS